MNDPIEKIKDENEDGYSNDDIYNINSWGADLSFRELITMYEENELIKPELQRNYIWDKVEASRFIDSLLLGLPVPSIFLANTSDNQKLIIDGYQRIMTVYDYVRGIWSGDKKTFNLSRSEKINARWRGNAFKELTSAEQRKIRSTTIHSIIFEQALPRDDDTSLFQIFERINTGGRALMSQEIRNCVYQGELNKLLITLNKNTNWRTLFGADIDPRMRDMEFILRYFALNNDTIKNHEKGSISLKKLLNEFMGNKENSEQKFIEQGTNQFTETISFIYKYIGQNAFFNIRSNNPEKIRKRFYPTIFDSLAVATSIALNTLGNKIPVIGLEEKRMALLQNEDYKKYITQGTMQIESIHGRIGMVLEKLYGLQYRE
ncbi:DUF262 domain-containing protein [Candidatus Nitrotoga fabula]|uniref:GmrSD restriction endonucleases N-terminal domain-containing protein n=1 Tax=Candidatus Nitrotoga fabula TaxID=2182327 RepID=A0A916BEM4_9PROT|nr:DUF262 domain-containing protein [Candidatus Nitrotoga fabula]CAE6710120.1 conserved hypothetical protein [Candidatus Nitrotoga fabula]